MKKISILLSLFVLFGISQALAGTRRSGGLEEPHQVPGSTMNQTTSFSQIQRFQENRQIPQGDFNRAIYNPYFSIYYGPLYEPYEEPCYYDEAVGQWIGPCDVDLSQPGFSRTIPNKIR